MQIYTKGTARIRHSGTGDIYEIESHELDWQHVGSDERQMGPEIFYSAAVEHPQLGSLYWEISEYPIGAECYRDTDVGNHELVENFDFGFAHEPEEPDDDERREASIEEMVGWFFENYEDPAHNTPHSSSDGGYQYIYGGPYDAREVLGDNFPSVPEEWINEAVDRIQKDGTYDWAPVNRGDEYAEPDDESDFNEVPDQEPGLQFGIASDGRVTLLHAGPPSIREREENADLLEALRQAAARLVSSLQGTNAQGHLLEAAHSYCSALVGPLSVPIVYASGLRLENAREALRRSEDLPPLLADTDERLATTLMLHGTYIASTGLGRTLLEAAREYARTTAETEEDRARKQRLADAIAAAPDVFDDSVRELPVELLRESGTGPVRERSTAAANSTTRNLLKVMAGAVGALFITGIAQSAPGILFVDGVAVATNALWTFVTQHVGLLGELAAAHGPNLQGVRAVFEQVAERLRRQPN